MILRSSKFFMFLLCLLILLFFLTATFLRNGFYLDEVALLRDTVQKSPNKDRTHYNLGTALKTSGNLELARVEWEKTVKIEPRHSEALNQLGNLFFFRNAFQEAERYYALAVQTKPSNAEAHYNLALTSERLNKTDQAVLHYRLFLENVPPGSEYSELAAEVSRKMSLSRKKD